MMYTMLLTAAPKLCLSPALAACVTACAVPTGPASPLNPNRPVTMPMRLLKIMRTVEYISANAFLMSVHGVLSSPNT